jgi:hypothetical protein
MLGLQPPHMPRDSRQFPEGNLKPPEDLARSETAQRFDVLIRDAAEAELVGDAIHVAEEPRKAVGERAVEVENDKRVAHHPNRIRGVQWCRVLCFMSINIRGGIDCALSALRAGRLPITRRIKVR